MTCPPCSSPSPPCSSQTTRAPPAMVSLATPSDSGPPPRRPHSSNLVRLLPGATAPALPRFPPQNLTLWCASQNPPSRDRRPDLLSPGCIEPHNRSCGTATTRRPRTATMQQHRSRAAALTSSPHEHHTSQAPNPHLTMMKTAPEKPRRPDP
nr:uncharacterized protein LOC127325636 [Lolium perenne]